MDIWIDIDRWTNIDIWIDTNRWIDIDIWIYLDRWIDIDRCRVENQFTQVSCLQGDIVCILQESVLYCVIIVLSYRILMLKDQYYYIYNMYYYVKCNG